MINSKEPLLNLPPTTKLLLGILIAIHVGLMVVAPVEIRGWVIMNLSFIPQVIIAHDWNSAPFYPLTPLTHMLLHGSWLHLGMNCVMLLAFGSGIERWIGGQKMLFIMVMSGLCGAALHFALNIQSLSPMIGASGGLSGLFAAALIMMQRHNPHQSQYGIWPFVLLWVAISFVLGSMGGPDGSAVAWAAHIGGFLGGFLSLALLKKKA